MDTPTQESSPKTLPELAEASKAHRLSPADEDRATTLLKELLVGGKAGIVAALEPMLSLPWIVCVNAVSAVWPGLTLPMKRHLLATLAKSDTEQARRLRLSVARAVFKIDPAAGLKIAAAVATDLKDAETGSLSSKHRQMFFHVFVGKGKPWLLQLPLGELKAADADALVHAAIESFSFCPPLSQLSILRWVHAGGRFKKISDADLAIAVKSVSRWNARLQQQLKAEVAELPEAILAAFKPEPAKREETPGKAQETKEAPQAPAEPAEQAQEAGEPVQAAAPEEAPTQPQTEPQAQPTPPPAAGPEAITIPRREREREKERERGGRREERPSREGRQQPPEAREVRESREPEKGRKAFDFKDSLRGLEAYVNGLKTELEQTRTQLRRREEELKRGRSARPERVEERRPTADAETLARHNAQLEAAVKELRQQLDDLATYHEAVAESRQLHGDEPLPEGSAESLKSLLSIKLQESYEAYTAMRLEPLDRVFRLDYRDLLGSVFDVLLHEGIRLENKS